MFVPCETFGDHLVGTVLSRGMASERVFREVLSRRWPPRPMFFHGLLGLNFTAEDIWPIGNSTSDVALIDAVLK